MADNEATTGTTNDQSTTSGDSANGSSGDNSGGTGGATTGAGTLTQAQVDAIVRDRIAREREKYKGFEDLKRKAEEYDKVTAANQTDLEKAQTEAQKASERAATAEGRMKNALTRAAIVSEASKQGARDPSLLVRLIDSDSLEITDDGLQYLNEMKQLERLNLEFTKVNKESLLKLKKTLPQLQLNF